MPRVSLDEAYPGISFRPRSRNLLARLMAWPAECVHLESSHSWIATYIPDTLYLRGKASRRRSVTRPEVSLCLACLIQLLAPELERYPGRVVAFEPDGESFTQYFFVEAKDFTAAGLVAEVGVAIEKRAAAIRGTCTDCSSPARWLWISRREVSSLDQIEQIEATPGAMFCARHGAAKLCDALAGIEQANLFYVNAPYGESGAYVWI